jgi:hypothetical protein
LEDQAFYIILIAAFCGMAWVYYKKKFTRYIFENYEKVYRSLGRPALKNKRFYTAGEIQGEFSELRYLLSGEYKKLNDSEFEKIET